MSETNLPAEKVVIRRRRGKQRLKELLDATETLLAENDVGEVGLYQIAERAGVPAASIYHFFPNKEAALIALAERYVGDFYRLAAQAPDGTPRSWQELLESKVRGAAAHYNEHPALMKLFLGASISVEIRSRDMAGTARIAEIRAELLDSYFVMPAIAIWHQRLAISIAIVDGIWALSYSQHRCIAPDYIDESARASTAYLRSYLPEIIDRRN